MGAERMMSVWEWVGLVLMSYGAVIFIAGVYFLFNPYPRTVLSHLHPDLWWGAVMLISGVILFFLPKRMGSE